jgi:hypothetical protein
MHKRFSIFCASAFPSASFNLLTAQTAKTITIMKNRLFTLVFAAGTLAAGSMFASSHREAPMITGIPKLDGADFYMFNSYETGRSNFVTFVADYLPLQDPYGGPNYFHLETNGIYEISLDTNGDGIEDITFQFQFSETNRHITFPIGPPGNQITNEIPLVIGGQITSNNNSALNVLENYTLKVIIGPRRTGVAQYVSNAADGTTVFTKPVDNIGNKTIPDYNGYANTYMYTINIPGSSTPGRLFVGQRKDPFVVNLGETFDLINLSNPLGPVNGEKNSLAEKNVTSLILEIPKSFLTNNGNPTIAGWTTASQFQGTNIVQVSRLGMPLVNEVVIGLKDKDNFNASQPKNDAQFANYVTNPTFPALVQLLFGSAGVVAPTNFPRADLVEVFLTGVPGLNQTSATAEMLRLNTSIPAVPASSQNNLGVIAGDNAGFPNGRRPGDDVVDIALRVMMGKLLSTNVAPSGQLPFTDGAYVDANAFASTFPYISPPLAGSPNNLSVNVTLQSSPNVAGPYVAVPVSYNSANSTLSTSTTGSTNGFYRVQADQSGVVLGKTSVSGTNVVIGVQVP